MSSRQWKIEHVPLSEIRMGEGVILDEADVNELVASIRQVGMLHPPMLRRAADGRLTVVFGHHRVEAARREGFENIECRVAELSDQEAEAAEIDENLVRKKLSPAKEALLLHRRKTIYEAINGSAKVIGINAANKAMGNASANLARAFSQDTAERTGRSRRSIQRALARAERLGNSTLEKLKGTVLDRRLELDRLVELSPDDRAAEVENAVAEPKSDRKRKKIKKSPTAARQANVDELRRMWKRASLSTRQAFARWVMKTDSALWTNPNSNGDGAPEQSGPALAG